MVKSIKTRRPVIVDYGSGNIRSAVKAFEHVLGEEVISTNKPLDLDNASHIVLPGVGSFADCKNGLLAFPGLVDGLLEHVVEKQKPFLGICVGMQLMATLGLENGNTKGFDWIKGQVVKIKSNGMELKIPHMGWNELIFHEKSHPVLAGFKDFQHAYFVHSYCFEAVDSKDVLASVAYGDLITAIVGRDNIIGTQFHPEKSQRFGMEFIKNFLKWEGFL